MVTTLGLGVGVLPGERGLGAGLAQHLVLLGRQLLPPFLVCPLDIRHTRDHTRRGSQADGVLRAPRCGLQPHRRHLPRGLDVPQHQPE